MEQQPFRRRRRRTRRSRAGRESIAWLTYLLSLVRRACHWSALLLVVTVILLLGLGGPTTPLEELFLWWGHW